jgi:hypothetical protein
MTNKSTLGYAALAGLAILTTLGTSRGLLADDDHGKQNTNQTSGNDQGNQGNNQGNNQNNNQNNQGNNQGNDQDNEQINAAIVTQGFLIAPVNLNLAGKNHDLVGLGSYLVNAVAGCSDCHTSPPYAAGGNPFLGQPKMINTAGYLAGGTAFGPVTSRNLTPNGKGLPEGHTLQEFVTILRTGADLEQLHTTLSPLLQVMPWPVFQNMTDRDIQAIYEYLSTIPCIEGGPGQLPGRCNP